MNIASVTYNKENRECYFGESADCKSNITHRKYSNKNFLQSRLHPAFLMSIHSFISIFTIIIFWTRRIWNKFGCPFPLYVSYYFDNVLKHFINLSKPDAVVCNALTKLISQVINDTYLAPPIHCLFSAIQHIGLHNSHDILRYSQISKASIKTSFYSIEINIKSE